MKIENETPNYRQKRVNKNEQLQEEVTHWKTKYAKLEQIFRLQEEIIASYEAAYGEAPGLSEEVEPEDSQAATTEKTYFELLEKRAHNQFNQEQLAAITYDMKENLRIIAGAGSGKTQTICAKTAYMIDQKDIAEERILMITFTRNAANELKKRVDNFANRKTNVQIGTFHSIFTRFYTEILSKFPEQTMVYAKPDFQKDSAKRIASILQQLIRKYQLFTFDQYGEKDIAGRLDYWKNMNLSPEEVIEVIKVNFDKIDSAQKQPISERMRALLDELKQRKQNDGLLDFNDILTNLKQLLEIPEIRAYLGQKYEYLIIDEFQDTNPLQWHIVKRLTKENTTKLIVVGDDDQSIYGFRGSEPSYIREFDKEYPTKTLFLLTNYRSRATIVRSANRLIGHNQMERIPKTMIPGQNERGKAEIYQLPTAVDEAKWVTNQVEALVADKGRLKETIILYRSLSQTTQLVQELMERKIPFVLEADVTYDGIFGIKPFRTFYVKLATWINTTDGIQKDLARKQIYQEILSNYYVKKVHNEKLTQDIPTSSAQLAQEIISVQKTLQGKELEIQRMLDTIERFDTHPEVYPELMALFLSLPKVKKDMDRSEMEWLKKELGKIPTFQQLTERYKKIQSENQQLKTRLVAYRQGKIDALCLQSIHKSKGLSYRNVFLIGCNEGLFPHKGAVEVDKKTAREKIVEPLTTIEEERRLFYVAMTRARNRFYASYILKKGERKLQPSRFLKETGLPVKKVKNQ